MISICLTFKNRTEFLEPLFENLLRQDFDPKEIEICLADGGNDDLGYLVSQWAPKFFQIKTAFCDREELEFKVASNCPACDRNAMVCNMAEFEKVVIIDPEIRFPFKGSLTAISNHLVRKELLIYHKCRLQDDERFQNLINYGGYCLAFNRSEFIKNGGFDEQYALGFAGEDSYFIWWWTTNSVIHSPEYNVDHLWHPSPSDSVKFQKLRSEYTLPLFSRMKKNNEYPNIICPQWQRPEMIKELKVWKD